MKKLFSTFASKTSSVLGTPGAFLISFLIIIAWVGSGRFFNYSNTWQLVINTGTTIVTFLMVFLIQNTQNRDSRALHLKLDELLKASKGARNSMVNIEELSDEELDKIHAEFKALQYKYVAQLEKHGITLEVQHKLLEKN